MDDYYNGIYGNEHLSVQTILKMYDADNLLDKLSVEDLEYLIDKTSDVKMRQMYLNLMEKRRNRQIG